MKTVIAQILALLACIVVAQGVVAPCTSGPVASGGGGHSEAHSVTFAGVIYNEQADTSTWFYRFTSGRRPSISHITFELLCPDLVILDAGMWTGSFPDGMNLLPKAGKPEPRNFPATPRGDPTTGLSGLKFDLGFDDHQSRNYYFTVNGQYATGHMLLAFKAGPGNTPAWICGPSAWCETVVLDEPAISLTKTASPQSYTNVGQQIVYSFTVENIGNVTLYDVVVSDPMVSVSGGPITELAPGAVDATTFTAAYTITSADMSEPSLHNIATVVAKDAQGVSVSDEAEEVIDRDVEVQRVRPILECVINNGDGTYTAHFGYLNPNPFEVTVGLGANNRFTGNPDGDPITVFSPGRSDFWPDSAFAVNFSGGNLVWTLEGRTATASPNSSPCTYYIFLEKQWRDHEGNPVDVPADLPAEFAITASSSMGVATATYVDGVWTVSYTHGNGLRVPVGETYIVHESGLPAGWPSSDGVGEFFVDDYAEGDFQGVAKYYLHRVVNHQAAPLEAAIRLLKTANPAEYRAIGDEITYTFTIKNTGDVDLTDVVITDVLVDVVGGPLTSLPRGAVDNSTFTATYIITPDDMIAGSVVNVATVTAIDPEQDEVSDDDDAVVTRLGPPPIWSSVGDTVWLDENGNGVLDPDEPREAGVVVRLLSASGDVLAETETDASGEYLFEFLVDGVYQVEFVLPEGFSFTMSGWDSVADEVTGRSPPFTLEPGQNRRDQDAGLVVSTAGIRLTKVGEFHPGTMLDPWSVCDVFGVAGLFNAMIFGDLLASGGDTEGRLAVAGDAEFASVGYSVGLVITGHPMPTFLGSAVDSLIVGGDLIEGSPFEVNGNIVYGGERTGQRRYMSNGNIVRKQRPVTLDRHGNVPVDGSGATFAEIKDILVGRSAELADLEEQGVVTNESDPWTLTLVGEDDVLNVFSVLGSEVGPNKSLNLTAPAGATVLINVVGENVQWSGGEMVFVGGDREDVLFHYVDATNIVMQGFLHEGSVLAMHASAYMNGGAVNGRAVFGGDVEKVVGSEFHNFFFAGSLCVEGQDGELTDPSINYTFTVENTGHLPLTNVTVEDDLVEVVGGPISLQPDEIDSTTFTATLVLTDDQLLVGALTNVARVVAQANGDVVTSVDSDVRVWDPPVPPSPPEPEPEDCDEWSKPDFVVQAVILQPSPTLASSRFYVDVRVANEGDCNGVPNSVVIWSRLEEWSSNPDSAPDQEVLDPEPLLPGEARIYRFGEFQAPPEVDTFHVIAIVNREQVTDEYSFGNNFGGATYSLERVAVDFMPNPDGDGILLQWNSAPGFFYFVDRATGLMGEPFVDVADNLPATPPVNYYIDDDPAAEGTVFYRVWGYRP